jgi:DNA repair protein RecN (Recombination protein N)
MARTMLALKGVLSEVDAYPTLFFDEIDAEIGARLGRVVGERLERAAAEHQVICITHLPVVAAAAQHHFRVSKVVREGRTFTQIDRLEGAARVEELAEMIAGDAVDEAARTQACEMLRLYRRAAQEGAVQPGGELEGTPKAGRRGERPARSPRAPKQPKARA